MPPIDLNLLGLLLQTSPITVNAIAETGDGLLLGNVLTTVLNTLDATPDEPDRPEQQPQRPAGQGGRRAERRAT